MTFWEFLAARAERRQRRWELRQLAQAQRVAAGITWAQRFKGMTERQAVTAAMFGLTLILLAMVRERPTLWEVKLFEVTFQAVVLTGLLNMILAFHFAANKSDEARGVLDAKRADNTGKLADAVIAAANSTPTSDPADATAAGAHLAADAASETADALERDALRGGPRPAGPDA